MITLLLFACVEDDTPGPMTEATFADAYAKTACDQLFVCQPDSWRALQGEAVCHIEQSTFVNQWFSPQSCLTLDLQKAPGCLDAMAASPCDQSLVRGQLPEVCWEIQVYDATSCQPLDPEEQQPEER